LFKEFEMSKAKIIELDATNTCEICDNALSKYSCPKCHVKYCSLTCYQSEKHLQCSEEFYKKCIIEELALENNEEAKKKMLEILKRNHLNDEEDSELDSDDEDDVADITNRLAGVDLDNADQVWEKLTEDEQQEFIAFLKSEDVTKLIPSWDPWWLHRSKNVEEVNSSQEYKSKCPQIVKIKNFRDISKRDPANCVKYNLVNVLAAYAFATRYFNGEYYDFYKEVVSCVVALSLCLKVNQNFEDFETALKSVQVLCTEVIAPSVSISIYIYCFHTERLDCCRFGKLPTLERRFG
jgi:hypothetical protein